ncbi:hypothetical protein Sango_2768800 [Sesamum angolense]|uniref:Reverse transcriptase domain-containing protein n=1 Tax=Sesamum angolense TaxID=2727404 RepID=A0AAE1T9D8_9LAMI|nr:hypothetical protein Sango_2768800 [Sesamum angolense]
MPNMWVLFEVLRSAEALHLSHMLFANDTLIFCHASSESSQAIRDVLGSSGQEIHLSKSSVVFSRNTGVDLGNHITADLTIRRENNMELYLDLPSRVTHFKRNLFATIRDRIWCKIIVWNEKFLS